MKKRSLLVLFVIVTILLNAACSAQQREGTNAEMDNDLETAVSPEPTATPQPDYGYTIEILDACPTPTDATNKLILFDNDTNRLSGWSHIADGISEFEGLNLPATTYKINASVNQPDSTCGGNNTAQVVLVKKIGDWDRQHANGIEPQFAQEKITYGQVEQIVIDLKLTSEQSTIPTQAEIAEVFADYLTEEQVKDLDNGKANLSVTLFEKGFNVQSSPSFTGSIIFEIDPELYGDKWIRITIPAENLAYYTEQNYERTAVSFNDYANNELLGLRINPETASGKTVRHYFPETFDSTVPKLFKEMALSIARVEIHLKPAE